MAKLNIKKGDKVLVISGKEVSKTSTVLECFPEENKVTVKGLNIIVKHNKPRSAQDKGGIVKKEGKIDASNVMVVCPACNKATRVKIGKNDKGEKVRICKKCGAVLDNGAKPAAATAKKEAAKKVEAEAKTEEVKAPAKAKTATKATTKVAPKGKADLKQTKVAKTVKAAPSKKASPTKKIGGK